MRIKKRLSLAVIAMTAGACLLQGAGAAQAADVPVSSSSEVVGDIQDALAGVGAAPAVTEDAATGVETDLPSNASAPAEATTPAGTLTMDIPAAGKDLAPRDDTTAVFEGTGEDTAIAVQATDTGVRALVHIDSTDAPERFELHIGGDVTSLQLTADGSVVALGADDTIIAVAPAPWATDANGAAVPTHYEVEGTTLVQVVEHLGGAAYPVVADPWWNPFSWPWGKWVSVAKKAISSALKSCGAGALVGVLGLGITTGTTNILIEKVGSTLAKVKVGGVYGYVGAAVAGCIINNL